MRAIIIALIILAPSTALPQGRYDGYRYGDIGSWSGQLHIDMDLYGYAITDSVGEIQLGGSASSSHSLGANDVIVKNDLEVDGLSYFDGAVYLEGGGTVGSTLGIRDDIRLRWGTGSSDTMAIWSTIQTVDAFGFALAAAGRYMIIAEWADLIGGAAVNFGFANPTNPTLVLQSSDATTPAQRLYFYHNQTDGVIATGSGGVDLSPTAEYLLPPRIINASPAEPVACGSGYDGAFVYVDDNDDTAYGRLCVCANLDGTGYDWRDAGDIVGAACPFF